MFDGEYDVEQREAKMSTFTGECPKCGNRLTFHPQADLSVFKCPNCGKEIVISDSKLWVEALSDCAERADITKVNQLLAAGASAGEAFAKNTPLHRVVGYDPIFSSAPEQDRVEIIRILLSHGADANAADGYDLIPLQYAAMRGAESCIQAILSVPQDVNHRDYTGSTALHIVAFTGQIKQDDQRCRIAQMLVEHGADTSSQDHYGKTPLDIARTEERIALAEFLRGAGNLNITKTSGEGFTILEVSGSIEALAAELRTTSAEVGEVHYSCPACGYSIRINDIGQMMIKQDIQTFKSQFGERKCKKCAHNFIAYEHVKKGKCPDFDYVTNTQRGFSSNEVIKKWWQFWR